MDSINYYCYSWGRPLSGGGIFDSKLINALGDGQIVNAITVPTSRSLSLPIWKRNLGSRSAPQPGSLNIVSHEGLHDLLDSFPVDCFIIHNYFSEFDFPRLRIVNPLYRFGSDKIYLKIFTQCARVIFLSAREKRLASERYPEFSEKFYCSPPGHNAASVYFSGARDASVIEMPGTLDWVPKQISYCLNIGFGLPVEGTLIRGESSGSFISVVYDSFLSGFKLKLVEMAKHAKSIVSFCDLEEELFSLGFEELPYCYVRNRSEFIEAVAYFRRRGDLSRQDREAYYRRGSSISWVTLADSVLG